MVRTGQGLHIFAKNFRKQILELSSPTRTQNATGASTKETNTKYVPLCDSSLHCCSPYHAMLSAKNIGGKLVISQCISRKGLACFHLVFCTQTLQQNTQDIVYENVHLTLF